MRSERGFSFIEVLVAMIVLGIAVMAFAALQVRALDSTGVAHTRSQAMTLAAELAERMRTNKSGFATYNTVGLYNPNNLPAGEPSTWGGGAGCILTNAVNAGCTDVQMATFDVREIVFLANQLLPAGRVEIRNCPGGATISCVYVSWGGTTPDTCVDNTTPNCVAMQVFAR